MGYEDRELTCVECGATFTFTASEQEFFASKGFTNDPKRCQECRLARKSRRVQGDWGDSYGYKPREMHPAVCADCGKETEVPFLPREGRPVYCSECYARIRNESH